jgi:hypothetical protein
LLRHSKDFLLDAVKSANNRGHYDIFGCYRATGTAACILLGVVRFQRVIETPRLHIRN